MPLVLEVEREGEWVVIGTVRPNDRPGSMANITQDGQREMYIFGCEGDDSASKISKSAGGSDLTNDKNHTRIILTTHAEIVCVLREGDPAFELSVRTDPRQEAQKVRFMHMQAN